MSMNEAAERLRTWLTDGLSTVGGDDSPYRMLDDALAAERQATNAEWNAGEGTVWHYDCGLNEQEIRRATVERIRSAVDWNVPEHADLEQQLAAILDEEAAR